MINEPIFNIEQDRSKSAKVDVAGLAVYFELFSLIKLYHYLRDKFNHYHPKQGWDAASIILIIIILNLLGLDSISDIGYLLADIGFILMFRQFLKRIMTAKEWRKWLARFNSRCNNTLPCVTVIKEFLSSFHDSKTMKGTKGTAKIHKPTDQLSKLIDVLHYTRDKINSYLKPTIFTLDQDATLILTYKQLALFGYIHKKCYQPVNTYSPELDAIIHTEFRDGNVPAKMNLMEMLQDSIKSLPKSCKEIHYRGDSASCQHKFLKAMADGKLAEDKGVIYFAVSALMNKNIDQLYEATKETDWLTYDANANQEYVEVPYYEEWMGTLKPMRLLIIRTKQKNDLIKVKEQQESDPNHRQLSLELMHSDGKDIDETFVLENSDYSARGIISNMPTEKYASAELIKWARNRCGKSEAVHAIQKADLSSSKMPSGKFGANYAWWLCTCIVVNLQALLRATALPKGLKNSRFKAIRAELIFCAATVSTASRYFKVRVANALKLELIRDIISTLRSKYVILDA